MYAFVSLLKRWVDNKPVYYSLGKFGRRQIHDIYVSYFSQKTSFDISCKLFTQETISMKCQNLHSKKNKKNISNSRLLKTLPSMLSLKKHLMIFNSLNVISFDTLQMTMRWIYHKSNRPQNLRQGLCPSANQCK